MKLGTCKYCGARRMVETDWELQEDIDQAASDDCDCIGAQCAREREERISRCRENIKVMVWEKNETAATILKDCVVPIIDGEIEKVTVVIGSGKKAELQSTSAGVKVSFEKKDKEEKNA